METTKGSLSQWWRPAPLRGGELQWAPQDKGTLRHPGAGRESRAPHFPTARLCAPKTRCTCVCMYVGVFEHARVCVCVCVCVCLFYVLAWPYWWRCIESPPALVSFSLARMPSPGNRDRKSVV